MNLSAITARYIGKPFAQYGCIDLVCHFLDDLGTPLPPAVDGYSLQNYQTLVDTDIGAAQQVMLAVFKKIGRPAPPAYPAIGDLLVVRQDPSVYFPAVYVAGGQAIASFIRRGVVVFKLDAANRAVLARRLA